MVVSLTSFWLNHGMTEPQKKTLFKQIKMHFSKELNKVNQTYWQLQHQEPPHPRQNGNFSFLFACQYRSEDPVFWHFSCPRQMALPPACSPPPPPPHQHWISVLHSTARTLMWKFYDHRLKKDWKDKKKTIHVHYGKDKKKSSREKKLVLY